MVREQNNLSHTEAAATVDYCDHFLDRIAPDRRKVSLRSQSDRSFSVAQVAERSLLVADFKIHQRPMGSTATAIRLQEYKSNVLKLA